MFYIKPFTGLAAFHNCSTCDTKCNVNKGPYPNANFGRIGAIIEAEFSADSSTDCY